MRSQGRRVLIAYRQGGTQSGERKEMLFFEKKNQKTFVCLVPRQVMPTTTEVNTAQAQKFFGSFFQKNTSSYACPG